MSWSFHTSERMQWNRWTRKRRNKFKKRYRKQHGGRQFRWFLGKPRYAHKPFDPQQFILHVRDQLLSESKL